MEVSPRRNNTEYKGNCTLIKYNDFNHKICPRFFQSNSSKSSILIAGSSVVGIDGKRYTINDEMVKYYLSNVQNQLDVLFQGFGFYDSIKRSKSCKDSLKQLGKYAGLIICTCINFLTSFHKLSY